MVKRYGPDTILLPHPDGDDDEKKNGKDNGKGDGKGPKIVNGYVQRGYTLADVGLGPGAREKREARIWRGVERVVSRLVNLRRC